MEMVLLLAKAAEHAGVTPKTLKRWLRYAGYKLPPRPAGGRYTTLIPEKMLERVIEEHMPRLARASEIRLSRRRPRPKAHAPEGQQTAGGPTKA